MKSSDLHRLLAAYHPQDLKEKRDLERMKALLPKGESAFLGSTFQPGHFTASAFLLSPCGTELGLIFHGKLERWLQPGGHFSSSDRSCQEAAKRELVEETQVKNITLWQDGLFDIDIHLIPFNKKKNEPAHEHFDVRFAFQAGTREAAASSDARDFKWVPLTALSEAGSDASVQRAAQKFLAAG